MSVPWCHTRRTVFTTAAVLLTAHAALAQPAVPDDFVIALERTTCLGRCPAYTVSVDAAGIVTYEGRRYVRVEGRRTDRIDRARIAALVEVVERIGFFELQERYVSIRSPDGAESTLTDAPMTYVSVSLGGRSKRVEDYLGAPRGLRELERLIDQTAQQWIRVDVPTLQRLEREGWSPSPVEMMTLLLDALRHDEVDVVAALLALGADPNGTDGLRPLTLIRSAAAARALLSAGASPRLTDANGRTALARAAHLPPEITDILLDAGAPVDQPIDSRDHTALHEAVCAGNIEVVRRLLAAGANPSAAVSLACTAIRRSVTEGLGVTDGIPYTVDFDAAFAALVKALAQPRER